MKLPATVDRFEEVSQLAGPLHLAIGMFDGVHLGHMAVIESAVFSAARTGGVSAVLTFDPHPSQVFRPENPTRLLLPIRRKCGRLHAAGVDLVIRKNFDRAYASLEAADFAARLKAHLPLLQAVYVGENFRFGRARAGDVSLLLETGRAAGLDVISVPRLRLNGLPISSTRIREELQLGAIDRVNELLGYNYMAEGTVAEGAALGRTIGFPTMNLPWQPDCLPCFGVYSVRYRQAGQPDWIPAIANYGLRPTVTAGEPPLLEVHALEGDGVEPGKDIEVEWLHFLRAERKFNSIEALRGQITADVEVAQRLLRDG
ncbi:MAG: riboflavin biosynthesis protein RibF [Coraliomargarita sp. TMED73]|nr:MAG: riboflavin biosynthesis protein RibF [Coraliomargarita sp. TMED73]